MTTDMGALSITAVSLGFIHTVFGPDHYVPFVAMSRVGSWSLRKTLVVTSLCGIGHILSSVAIGFIGVALGIIVLQLEQVEEIRGSIAGWLLVAFGAVYFLWGLYYAYRHRPQNPGPATADGSGMEAAASTARASGMTPWVLFVIFLFGPCEPLIPLLIYPAAQANAASVILVTALFGLTTLFTMLALVTLICLGVRVVRFPRAEPFGHALAGFILLACGLAMTVFGM